MKNKWPERHYLDLFASAGLVRLRDGGEIIHGSPLLAASVPDPFTCVHCCEQDRERADALERRLAAVCGERQHRVLRGDANILIRELLKPIPDRDALSLVFADPYGLHLDFETVRAIASKRCDMIILLADNMDALRNWQTYYVDNPDSNLDRFLGEPGWRDILAGTPPDRQAAALRDRYQFRLGTLGYKHFAFERVSNSHGRDIYSLLFASRNPKGLEFWKKASSIDEGGQRTFGD